MNHMNNPVMNDETVKTISIGSVWASEAKSLLSLLSRYYICWLLYFLICRIIFVTYHLDKLAGFSGTTLAGIFCYGEYVDVSAASYLTVIPFLIWFVYRSHPSPIARFLVMGYTMVMMLVVAVISIADVQIYREWGTKLNSQAIGYLRFPAEAMASMSSSPVLLLVLLAAMVVVFGVWLCRKLLFTWSSDLIPWSPAVVFARVVLLLFFSLLLLLGIRGGVGVAPMNPSFAYFSPHQFANHAALNASWNLIYDLKYFFRNKNKTFQYMSDGEMNRRLARLRSNGAGKTTQLLDSTRPNIVLFIMESWTANVIESLGGSAGVTPFFQELIGEGVLFTDFYANGYRTSFGIPAVLSGFPSTPAGSILNRPLKMEKLPTLAGALQKSGYASTFFYGGDSHFDDMQAFLIHSGFARVFTKWDFPKKEMNSKWGVHDHVLFNRVLEASKSQQQPFFSALLTLSSHEPFEVPMADVFPGRSENELFKNSLYYTDKSLREFFARAREQEWYRNTLFIFVADHGSPRPFDQVPNYDPLRYHIPLLFYGEVLKKEARGMKVATIGSQADIVATVLAQLHLPHDQFEWSNNLLDDKRDGYLLYNYNGGFGWITREQTVAFDNVSKKMILKTGARKSEADTAELLKDGQAYMQYLAGRFDAL
jgi:phosphoglycerol transferase MdoB-like AlkP superfamily enzyme